MHGLAECALRQNGGVITLGPTTLLHEAYLNISGRQGVAFVERSRFLAYAARAMRGLLIDYARRRRTYKHGSQYEITLTDSDGATRLLATADELSALGDALDELTAFDPSLAEVVDLYFFCGYSCAEIGAMRGVSERTVERDWRKARLLLHEVLRGDST